MRVRVSKNLSKNLKGLPSDVKRDLQKAINKIRSGEILPDKYKSEKGKYKIRVGVGATHRAFFKETIYEGEKALMLVGVKPRKDAYRNR